MTSAFTTPSPTEKVALPSTRRERLSRERARPPRRRPGSAAKSSAKAMAATAAVGLLLATYIFPAYADQGNTSPVGPAGVATQNVSVRADLVTEASPTARDSYTITKPKPVVVARFTSSPLSYNFSNNPNNTVIQWPFDHGVPIVSDFGPRASPCRGCSTFHEGLDMAGGLGTPVQAIADGVVSKVGNPSGSFGVYAVVDHVIDGQMVSSLYGHMILGSLTVAVGDVVKKGQILGNVGSTGASSGPHLHLGIYLNGTVPIDPWAWMKQKVGS